jgi:outer membrane protein
MRYAAAWAAICLAICAHGVDAQKRWYAFSYGASIPTGGTTAFTSETDWASVGVEVRQLVSHRFSVGLAWWFTELSDDAEGTLDFRQLGFESFDDIAGNVSGNQFRTIQSMPLLATAHFYLRDPMRTTVPFVGAGAGPTLHERQLNIGLQEFEEDSWDLALIPEAGLMWNTSEWTAVKLAGRYTFDVFSEFDVNYWNIDFGVVWRF